MIFGGNKKQLEVDRLKGENAYLRAGLEAIWKMDTPVANGTSKKIFRFAEEVLSGRA